MAILEMRQVSKKFSGIYVNEKIDLSVEKGEIHALLGENGAGKTTLMNILFGIYTADEGEIFWKEAPVCFESPKAAIEQGIGMVHQHFSLVKNLTVLDNILLGLPHQHLFLDRQKTKKAVMALAKRYGLEVEPLKRVGNLSVGQQQRVEILKALYRNVELLILDEPTGVLTPNETEHFFGVLRRLKREGYAIIIITHRMSEIMNISDRVSILREGRLVRQLATSQTNPQQLSHYMIGRQIDCHLKRCRPNKNEIALEVVDVQIKDAIHHAPLEGINFHIRMGEILGIAGVEGNGQRELSEVIAGVRKAVSGTVRFLREDITSLGVRERFERGISYISEDRQAEGLVMDMSVEENLLLRHYKDKRFSSRMILNHKKITEYTNHVLKTYRIKTSGVSGGETKVKLMSGGNQQKVVIAREAAGEVKLLIASQPTRGLDIGAAEFVRQTLINQRNQGNCILLISADLDEVLSLSDRVAVMFGGQIVGILDRQQANLEQLGLLMGGIVGKEPEHE